MKINNVSVEAMGAFVEQVSLTLKVDSDAESAVLSRLERLAKERCPGVYCLTNPIPLETRLDRVR